MEYIEPVECEYCGKLIGYSGACADLECTYLRCVECAEKQIKEQKAERFVSTVCAPD